MNFPQAIESGFRDYVTFAGRAGRLEYWFWILFILIGNIGAAIVDYAAFGQTAFFSPVSTIFLLVTYLPTVAIGIRRLHDIGRTGWWCLIAFTVIGCIVLIVWACQKSDAGPNIYGPEPVAAT
jgi:uncharacterized membrane protein YhaH (DUF805 family)